MEIEEKIKKFRQNDTGDKFTDFNGEQKYMNENIDLPEPVRA